jgi:hypothetical protein
VQEKPSLRFDVGAIAKTEKRDDGSLLVHFRFRKVGPLVYSDRYGNTHTEYVTKDNLFNTHSLRTATMRRITNDHPAEGMIVAKNADKYGKGMTGNLIYPVDPYAVIVGAIHDKELQDHILSGRKDQVSSGYASWLNDAFEQTGVRYNHFAAVERGRAGPDVGFLLSNDSLDALANYPDICCQVLGREDSHELFNTPLIFTLPPIKLDDSPIEDPPPKNPEKDETKPDPSQENISNKDSAMATVLNRSIRIDDSKSITVGDGPGEQILADHLEAALSQVSALKAKADQLDSATSKATEAQTKLDAATAELATKETAIAESTAKLDAANAELAKETARADLAEKKLTDATPTEDALKQAREDGYNRKLLEDSANAVLPAEIKIDSAWSDRQIKEAILLHTLGYKADSEQAKKYADMADAHFEGAYQAILDAAPSTGNHTALRVDGGTGSGRFPPGSKTGKPMEEEKMPNHKKPLRMGLVK